ncbi:hypothetical protein SPRG_06512 [Saprolegnia parasitica CBS 223.65]|uniref:Uncharacterized protein n=1 Tax=Saprolegnia parasitica (strain CBS 223.65) TaxID=695850 RepID=A0A067CPD2_SAPPC|nr:hypothetical protein SPRG_06512 [Saprolegnia parasitica CBS 223.65]KDO28657.1 hypothetical protein SPRG_06512 [Saprolegnia parasitica CBS 223.65]|eukprot:XP_012200717.1 hypothetical protein SPRG_06512 [Saprolegnia parasitica CBS 223.65]
MAATFRRAVLDQPGIASMVFEFHFGLYEDVRVAFLACDDFVEFNAEYERYFFDVSFTKTFAPDVVWARKGSELHAPYYCLLPKQRDDRLPLHVAIYQGFVELTKRMLRCRPDLATKDAIVLAMQKSRLEIAAFLLDERATMPALYRYYVPLSLPNVQGILDK